MTEQTTEITAYERSVALVKAELTQNEKPKQPIRYQPAAKYGNALIARYRKDQTGSQMRCNQKI